MPVILEQYKMSLLRHRYGLSADPRMALNLPSLGLRRASCRFIPRVLPARGLTYVQGSRKNLDILRP